jgi:hypothetical protein
MRLPTGPYQVPKKWVRLGTSIASPDVRASAILHVSSASKFN